MNMDRMRAHQAAIVSVVVLALVCSSLAQQQNTLPKADPPTPTPQPANCNTTTTKPSPAQQSYVVSACIVAKFGAYFAVEPNMTRFIELKNGVVNQKDSSCTKLVVEFGCASLEMEFQQEDNNKSISVKSINGHYQLDNKTETFANSTVMFKTRDDHYYKCNAEQAIATGQNTTKLVLSNVAFEAFRNTTGTDFYKMPEECSLDSNGSNDLVRIGVGISLVLLAALVLVAYFVGRRRWAERSSYESV